MTTMTMLQSLPSPRQHRVRNVRFLVLAAQALFFIFQESKDLQEWRLPPTTGSTKAASKKKKKNSNPTGFLPMATNMDVVRELVDGVRAKIIRTSQKFPTTTFHDKSSDEYYQPVCTTPNNANASLWLDMHFSDWGQPHLDNSPTKDLLKVYVYETLPPEFHQNLIDWHLGSHRNHTPPRNTFHADIAVINLFETYPGRTYDPAAADLFVVPYAHAAHCLTVQPWTIGCQQVSEQLPKLFESLTYYTKATQHRHLFVLTMDAGLSHSTLEQLPLVLTIGPKLEHMQQHAGALVVPYLNDDPVHQPSCLAQRPHNWWTRTRKYAFTYVAGMNINRRVTGIGRQSRKLRREFKNALRGVETVGGRPYVLVDIHNLPPNQQRPSGPEIDNYYQDSVFCPTLPGDGPPQKRFFDVMLSGCLPVVLSWDLGGGRKSWWMWDADGFAFSVDQSYPFVKGAFANSNRKNETLPFEIDYESFVVQVPGNRSEPHAVVHQIRPTLEALLADPDEIRRRQLLLKQYAPHMTYGMGHDAHRRDDDAFAQILKAIKYLLDQPTQHLQQ